MAEMLGLSEGAGVEFARIFEMHLWTEMSEGQGSTVGAWGKALQKKEGLIHAHTLDWDMSGPMRNYPQVNRIPL